MKKAHERPEEAKAKPRKVPKVRTCQRCGHPAMKDYGHSQMNLRHGKVLLCAMQDGISLDLWQARHRAREEVYLSICLFPFCVFLCLLPLTVSRYSEGNAGGEEDSAEGEKAEKGQAGREEEGAEGGEKAEEEKTGREEDSAEGEKDGKAEKTTTRRGRGRRRRRRRSSC